MAKSGWSNRPTEFIGEVMDDTGVLFKDVAEQAARGVIYRSPKDTSRFLANNNFSEGAPDDSYDESRRDPGRGNTLANARLVIAKLRPGDTFYIVNTTPYGTALENGHSGQAPLGIYGLTFNSLKEVSS